MCTNFFNNILLVSTCLSAASFRQISEFYTYKRNWKCITASMWSRAWVVFRYGFINLMPEQQKAVNFTCSWPVDPGQHATPQKTNSDPRANQTTLTSRINNEARNCNHRRWLLRSIRSSLSHMKSQMTHGSKIFPTSPPLLEPTKSRHWSCPRGTKAAIYKVN